MSGDRFLTVPPPVLVPPSYIPVLLLPQYLSVYDRCPCAGVPAVVSRWEWTLTESAHPLRPSHPTHGCGMVYSREHRVAPLQQFSHPMFLAAVDSQSASQ
jgi:hypothetical protein